MFGSVRVFWEIRAVDNIRRAPNGSFEHVTNYLDFAPQEGRKPLGISPLADEVPEKAEKFYLVLMAVEGRGTKSTKNYF